MAEDIRLEYDPQPRQALLHATPAHQIFYGGAAGGGKSHALRWDAIGFCLEHPGLDAFLFRRTLGELEDNHIRRIKEEIPETLGKYSERKNRFEFHNGSGINFCYCEREDDVKRYQGAEIHWLGIDEASHLTPYQISYLRGRVRLGSWMPVGYDGPENADFRGLLPRIAMGSNPGGPGHSFLKRTFIDPAEPEVIFDDRSMADGDHPGWPTIFIPAQIKDNKYLPKNYAGQFRALAPEMAKALAEGDWDVVVGQALHNLNRDRHMLRKFDPPKHWTKFMCIDWGTAKPFSVGWYCVSDGAILAARDGWPERNLPAGALIRYAEWYGWNGEEDQGCRTPSDAVAKRIIEIERERGDVMDYRIGDSQMWAQHDGPSVQERMNLATDGLFVLRRSKKDRKENYAEFIARLSGNSRFTENGIEEADPMFFATTNCTHFWRTVPVLTLDTVDPDKGPDTKLEDHCFTGDTKVITDKGPQRIDSLPEFPKVLTTEGMVESINLGATAMSTDIYEITLSDGYKFTATGSHPILCGDEYRRVDELSYGCYVSVEQKENAKWHNTTKVRLIGFVGDTIKERVCAFTGWFGRTITGQSQRAITSITSTAIRRTMIFPIWKLCPLPNTSSYTQTPRSALSTPSVTWQRSCYPRQQSGMGPKKARLGTLNKERKTAPFPRGFLSSVWNVAKRAWQKSEHESSVLPPATKDRSGVKILSITKICGARRVYNLHVPGVNNFCLENGLIVHNCYDEAAYALRSRPFIQTPRDRMMQEFRKHDTRNVDPYATR